MRVVVQRVVDPQRLTLVLGRCSLALLFAVQITACQPGLEAVGKLELSELMGHSVGELLSLHGSTGSSLL